MIDDNINNYTMLVGNYLMEIQFNVIYTKS